MRNCLGLFCHKTKPERELDWVKNRENNPMKNGMRRRFVEMETEGGGYDKETS